MESREKIQVPFEDTEQDTEQIPEGHELLSALFNEEQITRLKERTKELVERIASEDVRLVVFLARSARAISWMLRAAWDEFADGKPMPKIKFANIGSEKRKVLGDESPPRPY